MLVVLDLLTCLTSVSECTTFGVRLVAVKRFPENTYFPEMLISGKGKCFPLFGCLGNRFLENQFRCLVRPNILWKIPYGNRFTENHFRCLVCGSFLQKILFVLQIQAPVLSTQPCNTTKLIIHCNIKNNHSN